jgi:hypothetical protein
MKRILSTLLALAVSATLVVVATTWKSSVPAVHAQGGCSVATLNGNYGFKNTGFTTPSHSVTGTEIPVAVLGLDMFDGAGNISVTNGTLAVKGKIFTGGTTSGTYTVNPDCTGSITYTAGVAAGETQNMVIVNGGTEIFGIDAVPSTTVTFEAKKE